MALTASVSFNVPALPENDVWFANAQAWANYWRGIQGDLEFTPIATTVYNAVAYNNALLPEVIVIDEVEKVLVTKAMFDSFMASFDALNQAVKDMRTQLKAAGLITNAQ